MTSDHDTDGDEAPPAPLHELTADAQAHRPTMPATWDEWKARRPSDGHREGLAADLVHRAQLVTRYGWSDYRHTWSSGEVAGTALVLDDAALITDLGETEESILETWAASLWGINSGADDAAAGFPQTRTWVSAIRDDLRLI